jgi:outer membrane protein
MRLKIAILLIIAGVGLMSNLAAQKIGYANIELILAYMPESKTMQQTLATYEKKLGEKLQVKQQYYQTKGGEYLELAKTTQDEAKLKPLQDELIKLEEEIKKETTDAQNKLMAKRQDLLDPIIKKLQGEIKALSTAEGYDYVLNTVDGSGVSIVLHGPEEHDLTKKLMTRLGIKLPDGQ